LPTQIDVVGTEIKARCYLKNNLLSDIYSSRVSKFTSIRRLKELLVDHFGAASVEQTRLFLTSGTNYL
jgi:hypothetical protein